MQPKFNKLITLLLLLGTFAFLMEAEDRIMSFARTNLSDWASLLPLENQVDSEHSINPYAQKTKLSDFPLLSQLRKANIKDN